MTIRMKVMGAELWGGGGNVTEHIRLATDEYYEDPGAHSVNLSFADREGFKSFPVGQAFDVTFTPVKEAE